MSSPNLARSVLESLSEGGVDFVVCGGVAVVLQGVPRMTHDLDLRVDLTDANLARFITVARRLALVPRIPEPIEALADADRRRDWVEHKHAVVYTLATAAGDLSVDVFLVYPIDWQGLRARADLVTMGGHVIPVSSKADLIAAKRAVQPPRKVDLRDIEDLEELLRANR